MKQARVGMNEEIGGYVTVDFLKDETAEQLETRVQEQLNDMGIESFGDILNVTHRECVICGVIDITGDNK